MTQKIVINSCFGGFDLSEKGVLRYAALKNIDLYPWKGKSGMTHYTTVPISNEEEWDDYMKKNPNEDIYWHSRGVERNDPVLVQTVEELGEEANGDCALLRIVEIPDGVDWVVREYDGSEWVAEKHRTWH